MKRDAEARTKELQKTIEDMQRGHKEEITRLKADNDSLSNRVMALENAFESQQRTAREGNLVMYHVSEDQQDLSQFVPQLLPNVDKAAIMNSTRLGAPKQGPQARPRPILVKFSSSDAKHKALKSSKELRQNKVYLQLDLTQRQQEVKQSKGAKFMQLKEQGCKPYWRAERLYYTSANGKVVQDGGPARGPTRTTATEQTANQQSFPPPPSASRPPHGSSSYKSAATANQGVSLLSTQ